MYHNPGTLILDAVDTDNTRINNELARDALLLMGGMYYATMHSEAAHSTLTPSQRLVLLTSQVPLPLSGGSVDGSYPHRKMKSIACDRLAVCKHWRWLMQCKVCDSTASKRLGFLEFERKKGYISSLVSEHGVTISSCQIGARTSMREHTQQCSECKECGEACICEDEMQHSTCKGRDSSFCEHGRRGSKYTEYSLGASICKQGRQKSQCKERGGASICEHGRRRIQCKECGGASICEHARQRSFKCKECKKRKLRVLASFNMLVIISSGNIAEMNSGNIGH